MHDFPLVVTAFVPESKHKKWKMFATSDVLLFWFSTILSLVVLCLDLSPGGALLLDLFRRLGKLSLVITINLFSPDLGCSPLSTLLSTLLSTPLSTLLSTPLSTLLSIRQLFMPDLVCAEIVAGVRTAKCKV